MEFRERLKKLRKKNKLTQKELAAKVGVTPGAIHKVESGYLKNPSYLVKLAQALGVTAEHLKYGKEEESNTDFHGLPGPMQPLPISTIQIPILKWEDFPSLVSSSFGTLKETLKKRTNEEEIFTMFKKTDEQFSEMMAAIKANNIDAMMPSTPHRLTIYPNDWLLIDFGKEAKPNDIVIAQYGDQIFVRQLIKDGMKDVLKPLNAQFSLMDADVAKIRGVVIKIIKELY